MKQSRFSPRLAKYLWVRFFVPLCCCLVGFVFLFLITDSFDVLQDFLDHGAPFSMMLEFFAAMQPQRLAIVTPMAFLLAGMYTFAGLSKHNEITALRASGISLIRTTVYIWITAIVAGFVMKYALDNVIPSCIDKAEEIEERVSNPDLNVVKKNRVLAYRSKEKFREWKFGMFSVEGEKKYVGVTQSRPDGTLDWQIQAETAIYTGELGWLFENGQIVHYDQKGELAIKADEQFDSRRFPELTERPEHIRNSLSPVESLKTKDIYMILENSKGMADFTVANCYATIYYRTFFPFGCLIALLFAVPLSINSGRGGVFANLGVAVVTMLFYYGVLQAFIIAAQKELLPPLLAAVIPTFGYMAAGAFIMYRKR